MKIYSIFLLLSSTTLALPNGSPPGKACSKFYTETANFDNLTDIPDVRNPIPVPYKGLNFQGFDFIQHVAVPGTPGIATHSPDGNAVSNPVVTTLSGAPEWTVDYPNSTNKTFSLESFYYACVLSLQNGAAAVPIACNIAFTAFKDGFNTAQAVEVGAQTFTYIPTTSVGPQEQAFGVFSSVFQDISYVLIQYTLLDQTIVITQADLGMNVDDVKYTICEYGI